MNRRMCFLALACTSAAACASPSEGPSDFTEIAQLDVGQNPHQISFSEDGRTAYVATAGEDRITVVDATRHEIVGTIAVPGTPLGVIPLPNGKDLAVARFQAGGIARLARSGSPLGGDRGTSSGPSLIIGPHVGDRYLVSVEQADSVHVFDASAFTFIASYPTGDRPFPGAATSDGRLAFVPGYADGTVTVIDLFNDRVVETLEVGTNPSGGVVLPGDVDYAVVVRGENRIAFINTASRLIVDELSDGIGQSPFSFVLAPNGRIGFVNNTESHDISVIDIAARRVVTRISVPDTPIVMAVHPNGHELWVSSEGIHRLTVLSIPESWRDDPRDRPHTLAGDQPLTEVAVMGMTHSGHTDSELWGLEQVEHVIRAFEPDVVCAEIAPDRWQRIDRDLRERDVIEDPRVRRFPEYTGLILRLAREMDIEIAPCAGWTAEMSELRNARLAEFEADPRWADANAEYRPRLARLRASYGEQPTASDDPRYIHSDAYDHRQEGELALRDEFQNDMVGPGGWRNINVEHYRLVDATIARHRGRRILVTFGGGHKYWLLERLRARGDVEVVELIDFLP